MYAKKKHYARKSFKKNLTRAFFPNYLMEIRKVHILARHFFNVTEEFSSRRKMEGYVGCGVSLISLCSRGRATSADIGREFRQLRLVW